MEVVVPVAPTAPADFNFDSTCSSPYMTAPSSPQRFGNFFFSAPTSPTRASALLHHLNAAAVPFKWEEKPGIPRKIDSKKKDVEEEEEEGTSFNHGGDEDFEFDFSGQLERTSLSADELFDGGKIRPLKLPPRLDSMSNVSSPRSPKSPKSPKSPRSRISHRKKICQEDFDPFTAAMEETCKKEDEPVKQQRGRERISSSSIRKGSRSLSPLRVPDVMFEGNLQNPKTPDSSTLQNPNPSPSSFLASVFSSASFLKIYRKWKLKDFLLFRSASEGHATSKDPLMNYAALSKKLPADEVKNSSFRSTDSGGSVSRSRRRGPVSPHELHYTVNRAVSEEMRRKTFLPYKQGLLGCLGFNPGVRELSRGIGSMARG